MVLSGIVDGALMTVYTALKDNSTPGPVDISGDQTIFGLTFKVTSDNMQLDGWWWYCDTADGQGTAAEDFALWMATGSNTGSYVSGSKVTSGAFSAGWNFIPCASPIPLTNGQAYRAVKSVNKVGTENKPYTFASHFFDTGPGIAGKVNGPLTVFAYGGAATNPEPHGDGQMVFSNGTDVTNPAAYPVTQFNETWYGMDVQVSDIGGGGGGSPGGGASGGLLLDVP